MCGPGAAGRGSRARGWCLGGNTFEVTPTGTFERGSSVLQLLRDPEDAARWQRVRQALLAARLVRVQPGRDDKAVTAWNGLAITALVEASVALDRDDLLEAAGGCAAALLELHLRDGRLRRASLGGQVSEGDGVLEDYGTLATGLLSLYQVTGQWRWREAAAQLLDAALDHFADPESPGAWFDVADDAEQLVLRPSDPLDGATPSGASSVTEALLTAGYLLEDPRYREAAYASLAAALHGAGTRTAIGRALAGGGRGRRPWPDPGGGGL